MSLNKASVPLHFLLLLLLSFYPPQTFSESKLPKLLTKQSVHNLVFIDEDGVYSYFQNRSGGLFFSSNYKIEQMVKGNIDTYFNMLASLTRKKMILSVDRSRYSQNRLLHDLELFLLDYGGTVMKKVGDGISPTLHLSDTWLSFYSADEKAIFFKSIDRPGVKFQIRLKNPINSYFIPEVVMIGPDSVLFTDLNKNGSSAIMHFDRKTKKFIPLFKTSVEGVRIELCSQGEHLYIGEFAHPDIVFGSEISKINISKTKDFSQVKSIYKSLKNDLGNMECQNDEGLVYFIQDQSAIKNASTMKSEVVSVNASNSEIKTISDVNYATHIINIDGRLLLPFRGEFYVLKGKNTVRDDTLKKYESKKMEEGETEDDLNDLPEMEDPKEKKK